MKYKYIRAIHKGIDYSKIMVGNKEYEIEEPADEIIRTLLKRIKKMEDAKKEIDGGGK